VACPNKMSNGFMYGTPTGTPLFKFDIENSSGTSVGGGEVWKGTQVLSNNNYTVTWTREFSAPTTEGTYSVLVYSAGAAADYIYCKMQMNGRTNGPKTSLVVAAAVVPTTTSTTTSTTSTTSTTTTTIKVPITTTTSTTIPPRPESPASLNRDTPSQPVVLVGGVATMPEVVQSPSSLTVTAGGVEISLGSVTNSNNKIALTVDGVVPVSSNDNLSLEIGGFVPATKVDVWLYPKSGSDPRYLRSFTVSNLGSTSLKIDLPDDVESGAGDIVISGSNKFGKRVTVAVPVQITATAKSSGFTSSLLAGSLFAIGGFFIFLVLRRREEETALN
jgi:hypothetical protein